MKSLLKEEFHRAFFGKSMVLSLIIGCIVAFSHVLLYQIPQSAANLELDFGLDPMYLPETIYDGWLAGNGYTPQSLIYFLILPILAALPFGISCFEDHQSRFIIQLYMRTPRKHYLTAKYAAAFVAGGTAVVIPLILNLLCAMTLFPDFIPSPVFSMSKVSEAQSFVNIFYSCPMLYEIIFLCIDFIMGGIFACVALSASFLSDYWIVIVIIPFFLQLVIHVICSLAGIEKYSVMRWAGAYYGIWNIWVPVFYIIIGLAGTWCIFRRREVREDVF